MARAAATAIENNFSKGLITEYGALNAPENACSEAFDCQFDFTGIASRRLGIDYEKGFLGKTINRSGGAIVSFVWRNVGNDGTVNLVVIQIGNTLYFYDMGEAVMSNTGALSTTVDLTAFKPSGAPDPASNECQFTSGNGLLFVFHPTLESFYVTYDSTAMTVSTTTLTLSTRDFEPAPSSSAAISTRPSSLPDPDRYNLANQGWGPYITAYASTSSNSIATGAKTFTIDTGKTIAAGEFLYIFDQTSAANYMMGTVTSYNSGTGSLVMNITAIGGSGTLSAWAIGRQPPYISLFFKAMGVYPSNADIWWAFKNANDDFSPSTTDQKLAKTNTRAPNGHFILNPYQKNRSSVSGLTVSGGDSGYQRASTGAFFAGRVFYAGINASSYGGLIFFSQLATSNDQFALCYQKNDPTSDTLFDLLPDDGGVISIPEAGTVIKLFPVLGALVVFATNGIWAISGSTGIGFAANDYTVAKISSVYPASASTFVDVLGTPIFWGNEDIYSVTVNPQAGGLTVNPLTHSSIHSFFNDIPKSAKQTAHGAYNKSSFTVQWLYRSTAPGTVEETYTYDRILVLDTSTGAFYPWRIPATDPCINAIVAIETSSSTLDVVSIVDDAGESIVDDAGDSVVSYSITAGTTSIPQFKYFVSQVNGSSYDFTWAEERDDTYVDWKSYDTTGVSFESTFTCVPKVHGNAQRKFQSNYLYVFYDNDVVNSFTVAPYWNYATDAGSNKIGRTQTMIGSGNNFSIAYSRVKMPGEGVALQYKFTSVPGKPFFIHGWSAKETGNTQP